ncbi:Scr1 family TA system antitoxin-like transcriptional regulator [Nocardia tengchongensis]
MADLEMADNTIRVLPFRTGLPLGVGIAPFVILDFAPDVRGGVEPTIVFAENYTGGMYFEERGDVDRYRAAHLTLRDAALGADISRTLLREAARSFENER